MPEKEPAENEGLEYEKPRIKTREDVGNATGQILARLITEHKELSEAALEDPLTGLLNRRGFDEAIKREISKVPLPDRPFNRRDRLEHLTLALFDIDNFKRNYNDRYGHPNGDIVIQEVAAHLRDKLGVRPADIVWRHGGEEFGIAFVGATEEEILKRLGGKINIEVQINGEPHTVTVSGGVTAFRAGEDIEATIARADQALYASKQAGRDRILPYKEKGAEADDV